MKNLEDIIRLSDVPWIQERKTDICVRMVDLDKCDFVAFGDTTFAYLARNQKTERTVYLPLGYNPETGNYQLYDLLMEAGNFEGWFDLKYHFKIWIYTKDEKSIRYENEIIAKLTWLNELIEEKEGEG